MTPAQVQDLAAALADLDPGAEWDDDSIADIARDMELPYDEARDVGLVCDAFDAEIARRLRGATGSAP